MMTAEVRLEIDGSVATLTVDHRSRRNAMTTAMWEAIPDLCARVESDERVRVVVVRGAGNEAFVAGADISEFAEVRRAENSAAYDAMTARATDALESLTVPVIAAVHGFCIGGGLALVLSADLRYASHTATFGLPPARLGIGYSRAGVERLVDLIGPTAAKQLLFTADRVDAETALRWGLVNEVVPGDSLDQVVADRVAAIADRAPLSLAAAKQAVANHLRAADDRDDDEVEELIRRCYGSSDYQEGVAAFLEKRPPRFTGT